MAEQDIVACSGCGKKFRIPDGSPPSGKFACTACGADVAWGGAGGGGSSAAKGSSRGGRKSGGVKGGRASARAAKTESTAASRGARRAKGRKAREEPEGEEGGGGRRGGVPKEKENKTLPLVIALMGVVLLIGGLIIAFTGDPPDYDAQAAAAPPVSTTLENAPSGISNGGGSNASDGSSNAGSGAAAGAGTPAAPIVPLVPDDGEDEESGIGGSQVTAQQEKDYRYWFLRPKDELFTEVPIIEGTTDEEAAHLRELAAMATDFYSGAQGVSAERELSKVGRKAMPFLISQFEKAWKGKKWEDTDEQFACSKIQQLAREITKADGPPSDLFVRFPPGPTVKPGDYERAARMWTAWWRGDGQHIEKFKAYEDEE